MTRGYQRTSCLILAFVAALLLCADVRAGAPTRTTPIVVRVEHGGFRVADAAIGAIAGAGTVLAAVGCTALLRLRREEMHPGQKGDRT